MGLKTILENGHQTTQLKTILETGHQTTQLKTTHGTTTASDYPWDYSNDWYTTGSPDWPSTSDGENNWGPTTVSPETSEGWWPSFTTGIPSRPTGRSALIKKNLINMTRK